MMLSKNLTEIGAAMFKHSLDPILLADDNGRYIDVNESACALLERPKNEIIGKTVFELFGNSDESATQVLWQKFTDENKQTGEIVLAMPDGRSKVTEYSAVANVMPGIHVSFLRDVTERKREEELQNFLTEASAVLGSSLDLKEVLSNMAQLSLPLIADAFFLDRKLDDGRAVRYLAQIPQNQAEHHQGLTQGSVRRMSVEQVLCTHPLFLPEFSEFHSEQNSLSKEAVEFLSSLNAHSLISLPLTIQNNIWGSLSILFSSSQRQFRDRDLRLAQELARRATFTLENSHLYQKAEEARKKAEEASRAKTNFMANMSHELRTPLNAIIGFNELMKDQDVAPEERREYHEIIEKNSLTLLHLINDVLDLSEVETGCLRIKPVSVELSPLLDQIDSHFCKKAQDKGLKYISQTQSFLPAKVKTDPERVNQILHNLLGNAVKFTKSGSVTLLKHYDPQNEQLNFTVTDTGPGIGPQERKLLFHPFSQGDSTLTRPQGGSGLGLVLSKRLAQMLGGDVSIAEPSHETGSTFIATVHAPSLSTGL